MKTVNKVDNLEDALRDAKIVWCEHVIVNPGPVIGHPTPHVMINKQSGILYLAIEEGKIKILCSSCFSLATMPS